MVQIVVIRPGATEYDQQGRIQGVLDVPLSDEGAHEVARLSRELKHQGLEVIYSSDCERARQTAAGVAQALEIKVKPLDNLQNLDHGLWQGMLVEDVKRKQPKVYRQWQDQPESVCPPEGEMLSEAQQRVRGVLGRVLRKHKQGKVGLVVPEPLASLVCAYLRHSDVGDLWRAAGAHGTWEIIDVEPHSLAHSG